MYAEISMPRGSMNENENVRYYYEPSDIIKTLYNLFIYYIFLSAKIYLVYIIICKYIFTRHASRKFEIEEVNGRVRNRKM